VEKNKSEIIFIQCVGIDNKIHACKPHDKIAKCGIRILRKKLSDKDHEKFNCYECTY